MWRLISFGMILGVGCGGSTASHGNPSNDAGGSTSAATGADGGAAAQNGAAGTGATLPMISATCGLLASFGGAAGGGGGGDGGATSCPQGQACCTMIMSFSASCVPAGQCSGGISNQCMTGSDCSGGQVCCSGSLDGGSTAGGAGGIAGFGGLGGLFGDTTCQPSCTAAQTQMCASNTDCPSGYTCQPPNLGGFAGAFAGFGGGGGEGGATGGFPTLMLPNVCTAMTPDAGPMDANGG